MRTGARIAVVLLACAALAALSGVALAAKRDVYRGETAEGRKVRLIADSRGVVIRGAITTLTTCGQRFDPFRARFDLERPLDRSTRAGFRDSGSILEEDDRFSARYRYEIKGRRKGPHALLGSFDLEIVFRKDGREYTTCSAEDVTFEARNDGRD